MDFVELGPINPLSIAMILVSAAAAVGGYLLFFRVERTISCILMMLLFLGGLTGFCLGIASLSGVPLTAQNLAVGKQIEETYGLELTPDELEELNYPSNEPEKDFEVFGSFPVDERTEDGFERTEVFLIWRDGEMALAGSPDGETFTELKR